MIQRFHSFLRHHLKSYLDFKLRLHYTNFANPTEARDLDHYVLFHGLSRMDQIDEAFVGSWVHAIPRHAAGTKNRKLSFIKGFFDYLIRSGVARSNPASRIPRLKRRVHKPYIYTLQEIHRILKTAESYPGFLGHTLGTIFFLVYACGLRIGEALNLNIRDVGFEENALSLWNTKFHKERLVPFSERVAERLKSYLALRMKTFPSDKPTAPFFRHASGRYRHSAVWGYFREILVRCGLVRKKGQVGPRVHDLRHSFAVHRLYKWYQEGIDPLNKLPLLTTYMGHISIENTQVYLAVTRTLMREGDRRFQKAFEDLTHKPLRRAFKRL